MCNRAKNRLIGLILATVVATAMLFSTPSVLGAPVPTAPEVTNLPEELIVLLDEALHGLALSDDLRLDALIELMLSAEGLGLQYVIQPTHSVADTFRYGEGNCLSFTLLFLAMAEHANINARAREVQVPLSWHRTGATLFQTSHVNVLVTLPTRRAVVDFEPDPNQARRNSLRYTGRDISHERLLAHFYNNRSAELLASGDVEAARQWSIQALAMDPTFTQAVNNRGVIENRGGQPEDAKAFYHQALALDAGNTSTLFNLINLHTQLGEIEAADQYRAKLEELRPQDPFFLWQIGTEYEANKEIRRARRMYRRALTLLPNETLFLISFARASSELGDFEQALQAISKAIEALEQGPDLASAPNQLDELRAMKAALQGQTISKTAL